MEVVSKPKSLRLGRCHLNRRACNEEEEEDKSGRGGGSGGGGVGGGGGQEREKEEESPLQAKGLFEVSVIQLEKIAGESVYGPPFSNLKVSPWSTFFVQNLRHIFNNHLPPVFSKKKLSAKPGEGQSMVHPLVN